jgi:hypothetical protein
LATGFRLPHRRVLLSIGSFKLKNDFKDAAAGLQSLGLDLFATRGTAEFLNEHGIRVELFDALAEGEDAHGGGGGLTALQKFNFDLAIITPSRSRLKSTPSPSAGYLARSAAAQLSTPLITDINV